MKKRMLAALLVLVMVFTMLPATALALDLSVNDDGEQYYVLPGDAYILEIADSTSTNDHTIARYAWLENNQLSIAIEMDFSSGGKSIISASVVLPDGTKITNPEIDPEGTGKDVNFDLLYLPDGALAGHTLAADAWEIVTFTVPEGFKFRLGQSLYLTTDQGAGGHELDNVEFEVAATISANVSYEYVGFVPENAPEVPDTVVYDENDIVYVEGEPTLDGWKFSGWSTENVTVNEDGTFVMPDYDVLFVGSWEYALGDVTVNAVVNDAVYYEITPHEYYERTVDTYYERTVDEYVERTVDKYYERTVDEYYERTVDEYLERTVDEYYERTVDEYYERPVYDIYDRYAQRYYIPTFAKAEDSFDGTLVTRLTYNGNTAKSTPINGGAFKNGHTYVAVNIEEASKEGGVWYTIADSSKQNGKKTPAEYNRPIEYQYNVQIVDDQLIISFVDNLAYANVGAYVYSKTPSWKNAPSHKLISTGGSFAVDMPAGCKETVYLYTHIDGLSFYQLDESGEYVYEFAGWDISKTEYDEDYTFINTEYGKYELVDTQYGAYKLVDTQYGEYELVNTKYGEYELVETQYGEYELVDTKYGDYELVDTKYGKYELVDTQYGEYECVNTEDVKVEKSLAYTGELTLTVDGVECELGEELHLEPGEHTFTVSGEGIETATMTVEIAVGDNEDINFVIDYTVDDVILDAVKHYADKTVSVHENDKAATVHKSDKAATVHESNKAATVHKSNKAATVHKSDKTATVHESDKTATCYYSDKETVDVKPDGYTYKDDIFLGDPTDPDGEYSVKLN